MTEHFSSKTDIMVLHRQDAVQAYMAPCAQKKTPHFHYQYELLLNIGGTADFNIAGKFYHVNPGSILLMSNMENHYILAHSKGYDRFTIRFSSEALATFVRDPLLLSIFKQRPPGFCHQYNCQPNELAHYRHMADLMAAEYEARQPYWDQMVAVKLLDILINMYRHNPEAFPMRHSAGGQNMIFDVQNYIEANVQKDLSLDAVSSRFFVNKFHLSHSFSEVSGYTFKQYVLMARLSKAKDLLLNTNEEIRAVSEQVGFNNVSHFIRTFKETEQISPLQYRKCARKK